MNRTLPHRPTNGIGLFILCIILILRMYYMVSFPSPQTSPDTGGYYNIAGLIAHVNLWHWIVNPLRTPVYPLVLAATTLSADKLALALPYIHRDLTFPLVVIEQIVASTLILYVLYRLLRSAGLPWLLSVGAVALIASDAELFFWNVVIHTESFTTTWLILTVFVLYHAIERKKLLLLVPLFLLLTIGAFLRPTFLPFPFGISILLAFSLGKRAWIPLLVGLTLYGAILLGYMLTNARLHDYRGITIVSDINKLGKIQQYALPVKNKDLVNIYYQLDHDAPQYHGRADPYTLINTYTPDYYENTSRMRDLQTYTSNVIVRNLPSYIYYSISMIPTILTAKSETALIPGLPAVSSPSTLATRLYDVFSYARFLVPLSIALSPFALWIFFRRLHGIYTLFALSEVIIGYITLVNATMGYGDFGRLMIPTRPFVYTALILVAYKVMTKSLSKR